jgi:hypothetical protein
VNSGSILIDAFCSNPDHSGRGFFMLTTQLALPKQAEFHFEVIAN